MLQFGFKNLEMVEGYLGVENGKLDYDFALIDIDTVDVANAYNIEQNYKNCFVTDFSVYSLKKGVEILNVFNKPAKVTKVLFSKNLLKEENEYLDYLALGSKVVWEKEIINFPIELANYSVSITNQIIARIKMRKLSDHYKNSLIYLVTMVFEEDITEGEAKKILKTIERG